MVEKQWSGCHGDWTLGFWLKNDVSQDNFLTSGISPTSLMQDLEPMDPLPTQPSKIILGMYQLIWDG
jgi:hypothetical protein